MCVYTDKWKLSTIHLTAYIEHLEEKEEFVFPDNMEHIRLLLSCNTQKKLCISSLTSKILSEALLAKRI